jgi:hypothetical protein
MIKHLFTALLFTLFVFSACTKTPPVSPTQASLTAKELTSLLGNTRGTISGGRSILARNNQGSVMSRSTTFSINNDGFITLSASGQNIYTYNLQFLKGYSVATYSPADIFLDFSY